METSTNNFIDYINEGDEETIALMHKMDALIMSLAPMATRKISWGMPTYHYKENLVHFARQKNHLGFYPGSEAVEVFKDRLKDFKTSKGAIQFPYKKEIPWDIIKEIVVFRVEKVEKI